MFQVDFFAWNDREANFVPRGRMSLHRNEYIDLRARLTPDEVIGDDFTEARY